MQREQIKCDKINRKMFSFDYIIKEDIAEHNPN